MTNDELTISQEALHLGQTLMAETNPIALRNIPETRAGDELFAYLLFKHHHGREPSKKMLFNDVIYRIKTSREILNPLRVFITDKEFVKYFIKAIVGDEHNVQKIAVLKNKHEIEHFDFPDRCCIKPTHASGYSIIRTGQERINKEEVKTWLDLNYYRTGREANYKTLTPKIIVESLAFNETNPNDYKMHCYNGKVKLIQVDINRYKNHTRAFYDTSWDRLNFSLSYPSTPIAVPKPKNLLAMIQVAECLAKYFEFIRIDLYSNGDRCLVGEITNCQGNANEVFKPAEGELIASKIIFSKQV